MESYAEDTLFEFWPETNNNDLGYEWFSSVPLGELWYIISHFLIIS
jgi:hypothetical protein